MKTIDLIKDAIQAQRISCNKLCEKYRGINESGHQYYGGKRDAYAHVFSLIESLESHSTEETELNSIAFLEQLGYTCVPSQKEEQIRWNEEFLHLMNITISQDGNQVCVLLGDNLQEGIAGFGDTLADAVEDFKREWRSYDRFRKATWKPSKEQMSFLMRLEGELRVSDHPVAASNLAKLYEQLKTL